MLNIMKQLMPYIAGVVAFASAAWSFIDGNTWPGILAALAGILAVSAALGKEQE